MGRGFQREKGVVIFPPILGFCGGGVLVGSLVCAFSYEGCG